MRAPSLLLPLSLFCLNSLNLTAAPSNEAILVSEFIFEEPPVPSCHASTIVENVEGELLAAWFGGTKEGSADVTIWTARKTSQGWGKPVEATNGIQPDGTRFPCWNPVLFKPKDAPLLLFYKVGPSPSRWWGETRSSSDSGNTWSDARRLPDGILGPIKNKPIELPDGSLLSASSDEGIKGGPGTPSWQIHFERSADRGATWQRVEVPQPAGSPNAIQPSILSHPDGRLQALGRTREARLFSSFSSDSGKTWGAPTLLEMPNPNSGTDAVSLKDGSHLLIYNHTPKGRSPLNVAISRDGKIWNAALVLEDEKGQEFSYPAIIQTSDGMVHATYTWKRKRVKHVVIDPAKLHAIPFENGAWPGIQSNGH